MKTVRFIMIGGFLGAGKTTALSRLARHYQTQDKKVGIITNDQADNLVDTHTFRTLGYAAEEIPGGCFCCRFDALTEAAGKLSLAERPDVLLAEPVGSCTDLVATVVQPLKRLYHDRYEVAPYPVLVDPVRVRKILSGDRLGGFSPKVAYIFRKQLEEADAIVLNKTDTLTPAERDGIVQLIHQHYPDKDALLVSARTGQGFEEVVRLMDRAGVFGKNIPEVDYDTYADGEAELGWLNSTSRLSADEPFESDEFLLELATVMQEALQAQGAEVAHVKMMLTPEGTKPIRTAIVNLTRGDASPELSRSSGGQCRDADLIVNARVHMDPEPLEQVVQQCLGRVCQARTIQVRPTGMQRFKPGRPVPTHRYAEAV